jgi:hypothetical protein
MFSVTWFELEHACPRLNHSTLECCSSDHDHSYMLLQKPSPQVGVGLTNFLSSQCKVVGDFGRNFLSTSLKANVFMVISCDGGLGFGQVDNFCLVLRP